MRAESVQNVALSIDGDEDEDRRQHALQEAFAHVGLEWEKYVKHDARYERPAEVDLLIGNPAKAKAKLLGI